MIEFNHYNMKLVEADFKGLGEVGKERLLQLISNMAQGCENGPGICKGVMGLANWSIPYRILRCVYN